MNSQQMIAMTSEQEDAPGWYTNYTSHPFYGEYGKNSCQNYSMSAFQTNIISLNIVYPFFIHEC